VNQTTRERANLLCGLTFLLRWVRGGSRQSWPMSFLHSERSGLQCAMVNAGWIRPGETMPTVDEVANAVTEIDSGEV